MGFDAMLQQEMILRGRSPPPGMMPYGPPPGAFGGPPSMFRGRPMSGVYFANSLKRKLKGGTGLQKLSKDLFKLYTVQQCHTMQLKHVHYCTSKVDWTFITATVLFAFRLRFL